MINESNIGSRIRILRQKKGLTQKELAGEHITRNMLSLIENGTASPSLTTLCYLAEKLGIPVGYFFTSTPEEERNFHKAAVIETLKQHFMEKNYEACAELCSTLPSSYTDDEIAMLASVAFLKRAIQCAEEYSLTRALSLLNKANDFSHRTIYTERSFHMALEYYSKLFRSLNTVEIPSVLADLSYASSHVPYEMIIYFGIVRTMKENKPVQYPFPIGTPYEKHIDAIRQMSDRKWHAALLLLKELVKDTDLPYFMRYRVLCDLESVSDQTGDLRSAYVAARKKLELLEGRIIADAPFKNQ